MQYLQKMISQETFDYPGMELSPGRILKHLSSQRAGPTIVFFAGIHGNEQAGVKALIEVLEEINSETISGNIYAISGNLKAISKNKRYLDHDLNRMWTSARIEKRSFEKRHFREDKEQEELFYLIQKIISESRGALYFIDLHTTSSRSLPFITINDSLINRRFSRLFPVPVILGIEEYLQGPLLSYINKLGYVSLGFESGQHTSPQAVVNAKAFIRLALHFSGVLKTADINNEIGTLSNAASYNRKIYEIIYRYNIRKHEHFEMQPGFSSFEFHKKGTLIASSDEKDIYLDRNATLFMPLYQKKGEDGYYLIQKIRPVFLKMSTFFRNINADSFLTILPGVKWGNPERSSLIINLRIARFFAKRIFHLLGYRAREVGPYYIKISSRDRLSKTHLYEGLDWYKKTLSVKKGFE